ncbi:MAG: O-methyltransferase [Chloroflexi bacterium]|nr:O-methyltransferase [Chloroflexota bacterium]MCC6893976.1 O-methyltransferase [Anaerolineae bacterium]
MADALNDTLRTLLDTYVADTFVQEDDVLQWVQSEAARHELPAISVRGFEGRLLQMLVYISGAKQIVEIGTLAGYSGVWLARALPAGGRLYTLEKSSKHAAVARATFERAGLNRKVELLEGDAMTSLNQLAPRNPFDMVFIDADRPHYHDYLNWAAENLRPGGLVAAHNAFRSGRVLAPENEDDRFVAAFNAALAKDTRFEAFVMAIGDGLSVGVRR